MMKTLLIILVVSGAAARRPFAPPPPLRLSGADDGDDALFGDSLTDSDDAGSDRERLYSYSLTTFSPRGRPASPATLPASAGSSSSPAAPLGFLAALAVRERSS